MTKRLQDIFAIDLNSLALFRVGLGFLTIADLINRATNLNAHYTDFGVLPRDVLIGQFLHPWKFSLHLISGKIEFQFLIFVVHALIALLLILGWRTKLMSILGWIFIISLHNRNRMVLQGGDVLFRMLWFWAIFLPLGAKFSIDAALIKTKKKLPASINNICTAGLLIQIASVYWFTVMFKYGKEWRSEFTAAYYALHIDQFATPLGIWIRQYYLLLKQLTIATILIETIAPILIFLPFKTTLFRLICITLLIGMHTAFGLFMELGLFPYICALAWLVFLPNKFWSWMDTHMSIRFKRPLQLYYDGNCRFCYKSASILQQLLLLTRTQILDAQNNPQILAEMKRQNSWIVVNYDKQMFNRYEAFAELCYHSPLFFWIYPILKLPLVNRMGTILYLLISHKREYWSRWFDGLQLQAPKRLSPSLPTQVIAGFFILATLVYNLSSLDNQPIHFPKHLKTSMRIFRYDQRWRMFSPRPSRDDGWYLIKGTLGNGTEVNVWEPGSKLPIEKPELVSATFPNQRWRKYLMNIGSSESKKHRLYFGRYLCRRWNKKSLGYKRLNRFQIYYMQEETMNYGFTKDIKQLSLWRHRCFDEDLEAEYKKVIRPNDSNKNLNPAPRLIKETNEGRRISSKN